MDGQTQPGFKFSQIIIILELVLLVFNRIMIRYRYLIKSEINMYRDMSYKKVHSVSK